MRPPTYAGIAILAAAFFLLIALDHRIYRQTIHVPQMVRAPLHNAPQPLEKSLRAPIERVARVVAAAGGWGPRILLRKAYSVAAFAVVGFFISMALRHERQRQRYLTTIALTATFSGLIEVVQRLAGSDELFRSSLFDVACGAAGGALGVLLQSAWCRGAAITRSLGPDRN